MFLAQWADWDNPQIRDNVRNIQEYYDILASQHRGSRPAASCVHRASECDGARRASGQQHSNRCSPRADQAITALLGSGAWPDSAFILTYDEGGGLFDHVKPILVTPPGDYSQPIDLGVP